MQTLWVELGERRYPIVIGTELAGALAPFVAEARGKGRRLAVLTDATVHEKVWTRLGGLLDGLPLHVVPPGEATKSAGQLAEAWEFLSTERIDRGGVLIALGGGVIGDLGGFAAACHLRGIDAWQVPTTLLAMVDSSVGGKTGINLRAGKNLAGAFHQPRAVAIGTDVLATLAPREFAAGMAEVVKYGLLGDAGLFEELERAPLAPGDSRLPDIILRCCSAKAAVVTADERETAAEGGRALLNLGHTFGHAIEQMTGYSAYLHGEAVAVGLCAAARLSRALGCIGADEVARIDAVVRAHGLPDRLREPLPYAGLLAAMGRDKKVRSGRLRFVVLERIGAAATRSDVDPALVEAAFRQVGAAQGGN